jgi:UDP-N-acetylmuramate dehydrogenase
LEKHPLPGAYTAGSFFKNLPPKSQGEHRIAAGLLLDEVGAREMSVGDAAVFERHANIIINRGNASCEDVLALTDAMRLRVLDRFGEHLSPEVRYVGPGY